MRLHSRALSSGRTMTERTRNIYFHPLFFSRTSHGCISVGSWGKGGHEFSGITNSATRAATTDPREKNIDREVKRCRLPRGSVSRAKVPSVGIDPCRKFSEPDHGFQGGAYSYSGSEKEICEAQGGEGVGIEVQKPKRRSKKQGHLKNAYSPQQVRHCRKFNTGLRK